MAALRLSYSFTQRSPQISPKQPFRYKDQVIPLGFGVSMDAVHMHHNETIFSNSHEFLPERWLVESRKDSGSKTNKRLELYMIAFSRGTRQCMLSTIFRRYEMEL
jgi:cytochrome P450